MSIPSTSTAHVYTSLVDVNIANTSIQSPDSTPRTSVDRILRHRSAGIWFSVIGNALLAGSYVTTKAVVKPGNVFSLALVRLGAQFSFLLAAIIFCGDSLLGKSGERRLVASWGVAFSVAHLALNYSFSLIPVADASAVCMTFPILTTLVSPYFLGERFSKVYVLSAFVALGGVLLIDHPSFLFSSSSSTSSSNKPSRPIGVLLAAAAAVFSAASSILNRKIQSTSVRVLLFQFAAVCTVTCGIIVAATENLDIPSCGLDSSLVLLSAVLLTVGASSVALGYMLDEAGPMAIIGMLEVPFVLVLQVVFLRETPTWSSGVGTGLVLLAVLMTLLAKRSRSWLTSVWRRVFVTTTVTDERIIIENEDNCDTVKI